MAGWLPGSAFPGVSGRIAILEKRVDGLLASSWSLIPALSEVSEETTFLEKRVARLLAGGWSLKPNLSEESEETKFLEKANLLNNKIENGKMMFIYQAQLAFKIFNNILPKIDEKIIKLMDV